MFNPVPQTAAFVTVLATDSHICGAYVLGHSLKQVWPDFPYPMIALCANVSQSNMDNLRALGWEIIETESLNNRYGTPTPDHRRLALTFSKYQIWSKPLADRFRKVVFYDADLMFLNRKGGRESIDKLFTEPELSAVGKRGYNFNSGVMVLQPNETTYNALMEFYRAQSWNRPHVLSDQDVLNWFWRSRPCNVDHKNADNTMHFYPLSFTYNMQPQWSAINFRKSISVHFTGPEKKPWELPPPRYQTDGHRQTREEQLLHDGNGQTRKEKDKGPPQSRLDAVDIWWKIFDEVIAAHPSLDLAACLKRNVL